MLEGPARKVLFRLHCSYYLQLSYLLHVANNYLRHLAAWIGLGWFHYSTMAAHCDWIRMGHCCEYTDVCMHLAIIKHFNALIDDPVTMLYSKASTSPVSRSTVKHQWAHHRSPIGSFLCWVFQSSCWELLMLLSVHDLRLRSSGQLYPH